jgi:hypothetical protein
MKAYGFISIPGILRENKTQIEIISGIYLMGQNIFSPFSTSGKVLYSSTMYL